MPRSRSAALGQPLSRTFDARHRRHDRTLAALALCVCALAGVRGGSVHAADPPPPQQPASADDVDVIEFLGSVGSDDADWINYLAQTDTAKGSTAPKSPPGNDESKKND
jgi:hypothetical protein